MMMKHKKILLVAGVLLCLYSCDSFFMICSLNPFYTEKNIRLLPEIEGSWSAEPYRSKSDTTNKENSNVWEKLDTTSVWSIQRSVSEEIQKDVRGNDSIIKKTMNYYDINLIANGSESSLHTYKIVFFEIKNSIYADFSPVKSNALADSKLAHDNYLEVHTLAKVIRNGEKFTVSWLGADCVKDMLESKRVRVNYRFVKEANRLLLTGSSSELTEMLARYGNETRFIDWKNQQAMLNLNRIK